MNTAAVATALGVPRSSMRKALAGSRDLTVDELLKIVEVLEIDPSEMGATGLPTEVPEVEASAHWGNQPEELVRMGFSLGCDFMFLARTEDLAASGLPAFVLEQYAGKSVPIRFDAAYHKYNQPEYDEPSLTVKLSFDALYTCTFPWEAIEQVVFFPIPPEREEEPEAPDGSAPFLRLVR